MFISFVIRIYELKIIEPFLFLLVFFCFVFSGKQPASCTVADLVLSTRACQDSPTHSFLTFFRLQLAKRLENKIEIDACSGYKQ